MANQAHTGGDASEVVARIQFPGITQNDFDQAFSTIGKSKQAPCPQKGFTKSYFSPGGYYGEDWWQLDFSLALTGYKWASQAFCEDSILNFETAQRPDGRIPLWGSDGLPEGERFSKQRIGVSSLPKIFDAAHQLVRRSTDLDFAGRIYVVLKKYFQWWMNHRLDARTGLFSAVFEETFIPYLGVAGEWAPPDTNMELIHACGCLAAIAGRLGLTADREFYLARQKETQRAVIEYLWDGKRSGFFPYLLKEQKLAPICMNSIFIPLRCRTASPEQKAALLKRLTNHDEFNWNTIPLTSVNRQSPEFTIIQGDYCGNPCWSGSVWTLLNESIARGLMESGERMLAAQLAYRTVLAFNGNYAEFLNPTDGTGHGVKDYVWSAAQYIELLLDVIFGLDYDAESRTITAEPAVAPELYGQRIAIHSLILPNGQKISVNVSCEEHPWIELELDGQRYSSRDKVQIHSI